MSSGDENHKDTLTTRHSTNDEEEHLSTRQSRANKRKSANKSVVFEQQEIKLEEDLNKSKEEHKEQLKIESSEREALKRTLSDIEPEKHFSSTASSSASMIKLQNEIEKLKEDNMQMAARSAEMRSEIEVLNYRLVNSAEDLIESNANNTTYLSKIKSMTLKLKGVAEKELRLNKRVADLEDKVLTREKLMIENKLSGIYVANPDYSPPETQGSGELISLEAKDFVDEYREDENERFYVTFDRIVKELLTSKERISNLESNLDTANANLAKIKESKIAMQNELEENLNTEQELHQDALQKFKQAKAKAANLETDNEELEAEVERLKVKLKGSEKMYEKLNGIAEKLRVENNRLRNN